ncbi:MAG: PTS sugar transporter subunit IIA [Candidatus Latescibacterota bacterium]|nr:MAG: PTS sugar transporter subunit IIA [Candidatus Latescibacterota bacterium]
MVKLADLFDEQSVVLDLEPTTKDDLLATILEDLDGKSLIENFDQALSDVIEREKVMSTGIGNGVAIPHAYTDGVDRLVAGFYRTRDGVDFAALDGKDVDLFVIILGPKASRRDHIKILARISRLLNNSEFRSELRGAKAADDVMAVFKRFGDR